MVRRAGACDSALIVNPIGSSFGISFPNSAACRRVSSVSSCFIFSMA